MPAYDLPPKIEYSRPAIEQRLSAEEVKSLRKSPLELILAQNANPKVIGTNPDIETVPWQSYKQELKKVEPVFVIYYSSKDDGHDEFRMKYSINESSMKLMEWVIQNYGDVVKRFILVDLPFDEKIGKVSYDGTKILYAEFDKNSYPSLALYKDGKSVIRVRGPPIDSDIENNFSRYKSEFDKNLIPLNHSSR